MQLIRSRITRDSAYVAVALVIPRWLLWGEHP